MAKIEDYSDPELDFGYILFSCAWKKHQQVYCIKFCGI